MYVCDCCLELNNGDFRSCPVTENFARPVWNFFADLLGFIHQLNNGHPACVMHWLNKAKSSSQ